MTKRKCWLCEDRDEGLKKIINEPSKLAEEEYKVDTTGQEQLHVQNYAK